MALAKELVGPFPVGQARAIGGQYSAITAVGSTQADAATLTASMCVVASADGTKGAVLSGDVGDEVWAFNNSGSTLKVYPDSGAAIAVPGTGLGTADASYAHTTYAVVVYKKITTTQWLIVKSA